MRVHYARLVVVLLGVGLQSCVVVDTLRWHQMDEQSRENALRQTALVAYRKYMHRHAVERAMPCFDSIDVDMSVRQIDAGEYVVDLTPRGRVYDCCEVSLGFCGDVGVDILVPSMQVIRYYISQ